MSAPLHFGVATSARHARLQALPTRGARLHAGLVLGAPLGAPLPRTAARPQVDILPLTSTGSVSFWPCRVGVGVSTSGSQLRACGFISSCFPRFSKCSLAGGTPRCHPRRRSPPGSRLGDLVHAGEMVSYALCPAQDRASQEGGWWGGQGTSLGTSPESQVWAQGTWWHPLRPPCEGQALLSCPLPPTGPSTGLLTAGALGRPPPGLATPAAPAGRGPAGCPGPAEQVRAHATWH